MGFLTRIQARRDTHYSRNRMWKNKGSGNAADRRTLVTPSHLLVNIGGAGANDFELESALELDLNNAGSWDTTTPDYTVAANRIGKDFFVYACRPGSGKTPVILVSAASTYPSGYNATNSRKVGGFHCLCASAGTISDHPLSGYLAGDILPRSVWDLVHRSSGRQEGTVWAGATDFDDIKGPRIWTAIYLASGTGASTVSAYGGTISDTRTWLDFVDDFAAIGCRLPRDHEFQTIALGSNEQTNISGSADPVTTGGHIDTAGRRMLSNIGCEDCCGAMWQWLDEQSYRYDPDGAQVAAQQTATITYVASLEGVPIYLKWNGPVPYLCANIAADLWITVGNHKIQIKADATPDTGGTQIYFDDDATQPYRLLSAVTNGKDAMIPSSHPDFSLIIKYNADPATPGVELRYDNVTHNRLEAINAHGVNAGIDLSLSSPTWGYKDLPDTKGSLYRQGAYGDVKLLAGGNWYSAANAGSRAHDAVHYRWDVALSIGGRFVAEPAVVGGV